MFQVQSTRALELEYIFVSSVVFWCGLSLLHSFPSQVSRKFILFYVNVFVGYCSSSCLMSNDRICRVIVLTIGWIIFLSSFIPVHSLLKGHDKLRKKLEV